MALLNASRQFDEVKKAATTAISDLFPVEKKKHKLILNNVWVEDNLDTLDYKKQAEVAMQLLANLRSTELLYLRDGRRQLTTGPLDAGG